jgi:hypothetical protein
MSYIGSKPADAVLETDDITDGVITTSKLADNSVTTAKTSYQDAPFRNIIINGSMDIAQRGTSFADSSTYNLDRFNFAKNNDGAVTITQDTDVPSGQGFSKSLKVDVTTADTSIGVSQYAIFNQRIEAQNLQYLKYGTANAETLTLSFWVKSNKTGTYCVSLIKIDNTRYDYVAEYSISSASTWEKKTITIAPDSNIKAAGGAIDNNNDIGFYLQFALADGSSRQGTNETWNTSTPATSTSNQVNFLDSTANEWYVTGIQLEAGQTASEFEFLPVDVNLNRCYRFYYLYVSGQSKQIANAMAYNSGLINSVVQLPITMRTTPSLDMVTGTNYYQAYGNNTGVFVNGFYLLESSPNIAGLRNATEFSGVLGYAYFIYTANSASEIAFSAEL